MRLLIDFRGLRSKYSSCTSILFVAAKYCTTAACYVPVPVGVTTPIATIRSKSHRIIPAQPAVKGAEVIVCSLLFWRKGDPPDSEEVVEHDALPYPASWGYAARIEEGPRQ